MKKVLLVGAGVGQVPFLEICQSKGYDMIIVSPLGDYPCFRLAKNAKFYFVDIREKDAVLKIAEEEKIDAVLTDQNDIGVLTVAFVAEKLGLRGIGYQTALKFTDKYLMRQAAKDAGVGVPEFNHVSSLAEAADVAESMGYPLMIKPVDSSGSRGVRRINSVEDLKREYDAAKSYSLSGKVILERFIKGDVYCIDGYTVDYEHHDLIAGLSYKFDLPGRFIPAMRIFSSAKRVNDHVRKMLLTENNKLVTSMKYPFGITHAEYIYNPDEDKVYPAEIAARGGGNYISSDLIPLASGFNANEALIDYIINGNVRKVDPDKLDDKVSAYVDFGFPLDGIIRSIVGAEDLKNIKGVYKTHIDDLYIGKNVKQLTDGTKRYGMILISAADEAECCQIIDKVETVDGTKKQIWGSTGFGGV